MSDRAIEKIEVRFYREGGEQFKITARVGFRYIEGNKEPYFYSVCDVARKARNNRWVDFGGGADLEAIAKHFPKLAPLVKWHLCGTSEPMHYTANALYWYEHVRGFSKWDLGAGSPDPLGAFKDAIIFGVVSYDEKVLSSMTRRPLDTAENEKARLFRWLRVRHGAMMAAFWADMEAAGFNRREVEVFKWGHLKKGEN